MFKVSLAARMVKNLPAIWDTQVRSLGQENPLEMGMAPTPVFLPEEFQGQKSMAGQSLWGRKESDTTERVTLTNSVGQVAKKDVINIASEPLSQVVCLCHSCLLLTQLYLNQLDLFLCKGSLF